jgi:hypothetical protein
MYHSANPGPSRPLGRVGNRAVRPNRRPAPEPIALIDAHAAEFNQAWRLPFESSCRAARGPSRGAGAGSGGHVQLANVANTLWAYATMGREPGAVVMRELDGWAEAQ